MKNRADGGMLLRHMGFVRLREDWLHERVCCMVGGALAEWVCDRTEACPL